MCREAVKNIIMISYLSIRWEIKIKLSHTHTHARTHARTGTLGFVLNNDFFTNDSFKRKTKSTIIIIITMENGFDFLFVTLFCVVITIRYFFVPVRRWHPRKFILFFLLKTIFFERLLFKILVVNSQKKGKFQETTNSRVVSF